MTKETRVGLLVGLVIVIVFGMILTEFKGAGAPLDPIAVQPVIETDYYQAAEPSQPAMAFGLSPDQAGQAIHLASADEPAPTPANEPVRIRVLPRAPVETHQPVAAVLRRNPDEESVEPSPSPDAPQPVRLEQPVELAQRETPALPVARTYRVEPGDTLTRIAAKLYGPDKAHLYKDIYQANRDRLSDASSVYVGQELVIPGISAVGSAGVATAFRTREVDAEGLRRFVQQPRTPAARRVYVVQSGDNLTRIARKVYNDAGRDAVDRLYEANRDKLPDRDSIREGMTLRIPS
ncbi:MAG: LysM peptidoglycan-binding domain-containing protein [Phycisphaerae bacterium]|nr:LysM peptidoglycan-binding domain-containing protein [Phycisphaerae bacterium]